MKCKFVDLPKSVNDIPKAEAIVFPICDKKKLSPLAAALDKQSGGLLTAAIAKPKFKGKQKQQVCVTMPAKSSCEYVIFAGVGGESKKDMDDPTLPHIVGGALTPYVNDLGIKDVLCIMEDAADCKDTTHEAAALMAMAVKLKSYRFDKYFTKQKAEDKPTFTSFTVALSSAKEAKKTYAEWDGVSDGVVFTRNLVSEPANIIYPESFAKECKDTFEPLGIKVTILGEKEMEKLGMESLLAVGYGSERESKLLVLEWNGGKAKDKPLGFVGKGVTFDTGGISIKPSKNMGDMKYDMGGGGAVVGLMHALASRKAKVNAVGVVGLVENMPDGKAQRPGDVVTSMSGQTIEVLNTDAEGRLVLADALWYTQEKFAPKFVINLATLTGAIVVALGSSRCGLFSNDDTLSEQLFKAGKNIGEEVWRLPLGDVYDKQINSDIADMQNIGNNGEAGSITAGQFLQRFVKPGTPWAHLDIAGMAWNDKPKDLAGKGASGYGVLLLNQLVKEYYEK